MSAVTSNFTGNSIDAGRLEMLELVGAGTDSSVYLAIDHHASTSSDPVRRAIKVVQKAGPSKRDNRYQLREFRIHKLVSDVPGVHKLLEVHEDEAHFYLVSDYRDCDLFGLIAEGVAFEYNDERIRSVFVQILDAVHGCHSQKVYHRDLRPENILCTADGKEVSVTDFGSATPIAQSYLHGHGTNCYTSPECIGQETSSRPYWTKYADIWALGLILVNLISGGLHPWKEATLDDPDFRRFLEHEDYLESEFDISSDAADLLKRIFRMSPTMRPSLAQIRNNVLRMNTFFADFDEDYADGEVDEEESDDDSEVSSASSAFEDLPAAKPIDVSCFWGQKRPLLPLKRTPSDDEFACGFIDGLERLIFA
ncbi:hypothetical protein FOMPIDRAFT_1130164 [Fomitopsis schrenkii]|uniref:non-specific serine/threonine protein kinase n=1 Tax=Fomitopsis schrenkii TaxID=2126942 RepID=S8FDF9_FOMSC|nr:hypothetical protein FOMPIDRAFT_1130164 [Fomitopsis schrenkii]